MDRRTLHALLRRPAPADADAALLARFAAARCDDAFAELVGRYSRLVWGQCRSLLPTDADAEDAFQATFLALAQGAPKLKPGTPLGPWLHGVAFRVCLNARRRFARRLRRDEHGAKPESTQPVADSAWVAAFAAAAEEVQKLPAAQRAAFVLCCVECRPAADAAEILNISPGTLATRLSRAKQTLLDRLAARGLGAAAVALGGVAVTVVPCSAISATLTLVSAGAVVPRSVQLLTHGVTGMAALRFKLLAAGVVVAAGLGLNTGGWSTAAHAQPPAPAKAATPADDAARQRYEHAKKVVDAHHQQEVAKALHTFDARWLTEIANPQPLPIQYEYEPVPPAGFAPKDLEAKLADRAKNGWEYLGQVTLAGERSVRLDKAAVGTPLPSLMFRKVPAPVSATPAAAEYLANPANLLRAAADPANPDQRYFDLEVSRRKMEMAYQEKVAKLEKELAELKARGPADAAKPRTLTKVLSPDDFGAWDTKELVPVVVKLVGSELEAKRYPGPLDAIPATADSIVIRGSPEAVAAFTGWVKVLKK